MVIPLGSLSSLLPSDRHTKSNPAALPAALSRAHFHCQKAGDRSSATRPLTGLRVFQLMASAFSSPELFQLLFCQICFSLAQLGRGPAWFVSRKEEKSELFGEFSEVKTSSSALTCRREVRCRGTGRHWGVGGGTATQQLCFQTSAIFAYDNCFLTPAGRGRMSTSSLSWDQAVLQPPACDAWKEHMEGAAYHLASCIVLLGYMGGSGIFGSLYIFGLLAPGYFCYALWGWLSACGLDILVWNALLVLTCVLQLAHLAYRLRRDTVPKEFELLYKAMYLPLQVPLEVYREIVKCCEEQVQSLGRDQNYAVEGKTPIDRLSLLLSGR